MNWYSDGTFVCNNCDSRFKVYFKEDDGFKASFCPACANRDIDPVSDEEVE